MYNPLTIPSEFNPLQPIVCTESLKQTLAQITEKDAMEAYQALLHYQKEYLQQREKHGPVTTAYSFSEFISEIVAELVPHAQCRKGCSFCCAIHVDITGDEAEMLIEAAEHDDIAIDAEKLKRQAGKTKETWKELSFQDRKCVFLSDEGSCRVYENRPGYCRIHLVTSDPVYCNLEDGVQKTTALSKLHSEVVLTAVLNSNYTGTMAEMLLHVLQRKKSETHGQNVHHSIVDHLSLSANQHSMQAEKASNGEGTNPAVDS